MLCFHFKVKISTEISKIYFLQNIIYFNLQQFGFFLLQDLVVRVIFILGNLTARNDQARKQFSEVQGSINTLVTLFQTHCDIDCNSTPSKDDGDLRNVKHPSEAEDVLIKLVRVIANLSINPSVGASLATNHRIVGLLIKVLGKN